MPSTTLNHVLNDRDATFSTPSATSESAISRKRLWTGRTLTGLAGLFLLVDALMKVVVAEPVVRGTVELGYPVEVIEPIGITLLVSTVLYLVPRTAFYGALLLTGYLGGAVATHVRVGNPLFSHALFPIYIALMVWAGLALRDRRLEALVR